MPTAPDPPPTDPPQGVPDTDLGRLYGGPLEDFTSGRNELAKRLRSDGSREAADWVKTLPKPTRAAWLVNQLPGRKAEGVRELLDAGEELRALQEELIGGSPDRERLRAAASREQRAIDELLQAAAAIGQEHQVGSQVLDRVGETLQAASADPELARTIEQGRLTREQRASGLGALGAGALSAERPAGPKAKDGKGRSTAKQAAERKARQREAREHKEAERRLATAERRLEREQAALEKARADVEYRESRVKDAERDVASARRELER